MSRELDRLAARGTGRMAEKLRRLGRVRLAQECAQLKPSVEQAMAEEFFGAEPEWPEYLECLTKPAQRAGRA